MATILAIAVGGAIGSVARYGMTVYADYLFGREFPYGIFLTNILGSVVIGVCFVLIVERALVSELWRSILMVGFLGGFTPSQPSQFNHWSYCRPVGSWMLQVISWAAWC